MNFLLLLLFKSRRAYEKYYFCIFLKSIKKTFFFFLKQELWNAIKSPLISKAICLHTLERCGFAEADGGAKQKCLLPFSI